MYDECGYYLRWYILRTSRRVNGILKISTWVKSFHTGRIYFNSFRKEEREEWFSKLLQKIGGNRLTITPHQVYTHENFREEKGSFTWKKIPLVYTSSRRFFHSWTEYQFSFFYYFPYTTSSHNCGQEVKIWELICEFKFIKVEYTLTFIYYTYIIIYNLIW